MQNECDDQLHGTHSKILQTREMSYTALQNEEPSQVTFTLLSIKCKFAGIDDLFREAKKKKIGIYDSMEVVQEICVYSLHTRMGHTLV